MSRVKKTVAAILMLAMIAFAGSAAGGGIGQEDGNPANTIHPNILNNVGDGSNANPNGKSPTGGGDLHGIANVGGGVDNLTDVHGGIDAVNKNAG